MLIERNGITYTLTREELRKAAEENDRMYLIEDFESKIEEMQKEGSIDKTLEFTSSEYKKLCERFTHVREHNDSYWESYWAMINACIVEMAKEKAFTFTDIHYLKQACLMYENLYNTHELTLFCKKYIIAAFNSKYKNLSELGTFTRVLKNLLFLEVLKVLPVDTFEEWEMDGELYTDKYYHRKFPNEIPNPMAVKHVLYHAANIMKLDANSNFELRLYDFADYSLYFQTKEDADEFAKKYDVAPASLYQICDTDPDSKTYGQDMCEEIWCI